MKLVLATVLAAVSLAVTAPKTATAETLTPERVFARPDLSGPQARGVALSPDGAAVTYL